jgi:CTP synthase
MSRVLQPSKPYLGFVAAASGCLERVTADCMRETVNGVEDGINGVRI